MNGLALLNRNILFNRLQQRVKAYCIGLSDTAGISELYMADVVAGGIELAGVHPARRRGPRHRQTPGQR